MDKINIIMQLTRTIFIYSFIILVSYCNINAQEQKSKGGVHYSLGTGINYTEFSLNGANIFYEHKFNNSFGLRTGLNLNYYDFIAPSGYCSSVLSLGDPICIGKLVEFERLSSALFFSLDESINYYFNQVGNYFPYLGVGVGYFIFDNYLKNHPRANISEEELNNSIGYHILAGLIHQQSGISFYIKYLFLPANLIQYQNAEQYPYFKKLDRTVYLNIINLNIGYTF